MSDLFRLLRVCAVLPLILTYVDTSRCEVIGETRKLVSSDAEPSDELGVSVAIDGGVVVVGALEDRNGIGVDAGSVYLFDASTGLELHKLTPLDPEARDSFGASVAIEGSLVAVGSPDDDDGFDSSTGSVYLFDVNTGLQLGKILPAELERNDRFGACVALRYGVLAVGAPLDDDRAVNAGAVYLFDVSTGLRIEKILADDGAEGDEFGSSVSFGNGKLIVGAPRRDEGGADSGAAYLIDLADWTQDKLVASDGAFNDRFGVSVAVGNGIAAVGAHRDDAPLPDMGSVYLFDASTGGEIMKLAPPDPNGGVEFGISVAIDDGYLVVGKYQDNDNGVSSGSAFLFDVGTGNQLAKLLPTDGDGFDWFGVAVAIEGQTIVSGASRDDVEGDDAGAAYLFDAGSAEACLRLRVADLVGGEQANFVLSGGSPGVRAVTVYGLSPGETVVGDIAGYCATFAIDRVNRNRILGGLARTFDATGTIAFNLPIPPSAIGTTVLLQSAQRGTCPGECVSNLLVETVR